MRKHLTPSTVISCIALFVALSGAAYAATLGKNAVKAKNIKRGAVTTAKLKNGAVTAAKLRNEAVIGSKIANGAVGASKLATAAVRSSALGGGVVTTAKIKDLAVTEGKLNGNAVTASKIAANAVETGKLANEAVTGPKLSAALLAQLARNVSYETGKSLVNSAEASKGATATCPSGKSAIGGGARIIGTEVTKVALILSAPKVEAGGKTTAWEAGAVNFAPEAKEWGVEAHVICAEL